MSETEHNVGKLIPVAKFSNEEGLEKESKSIIEKEGWEKSTYHDTYAECLRDEGYRTYYISKDKIYKVECEKIDPYDDIMKASENPDGTVNFETKFYNGGCGFNEALDVAFKKLK